MLEVGAGEGVARGQQPVGANVISVDRAAIEATGAQTAAQLLVTIPQLDNFGSAAQGGAEVCDGVDNDCNGLVDDGLVSGEACVNAVEGVGSCPGTRACFGPAGWLRPTL